MGEGRLMAYFTHASGRLIGKGGDDTWLLRRSDGVDTCSCAVAYVA